MGTVMRSEGMKRPDVEHEGPNSYSRYKKLLAQHNIGIDVIKKVSFDSFSSN